MAVLVVLLVVTVAGLAFVLGRSASNGTGVEAGRAAAPAATTSTTSLTTTTTTTSTTAPPATTAGPTITVQPRNVVPENQDPNLLPSGLLCKDLHARGYSYSAAVAYWQREGMPNRMDADRNGIPCETVYPRSDVVAYWPSDAYSDYSYYDLPSGLLCADLESMGIGVYQALVYYIWEGYPSRMDADGNGIPCETVYPDAAAVWLTEF